MARTTPPDDSRDLPTGGWRRGARLLSLPLGAAGRATSRLGQRLTGTSKEEADAAVRQRAAEQLFTVLGELKGGAMKVGQVMSLMESALPEEVAEPYRRHLRQLQDSAPPMPLSRVHAVLAKEIGHDWRELFDEFGSRPAAAASIGQVHKATWRATGEPVAVKVQYPGADEALRSDLAQLSKLAHLAGPLAGAIDIDPLVAELTERVGEEVDYQLEAANQTAAADAFAGHPDFMVPRVLHHTRRVIVSQWVEGDPLLSITDAPDEVRNRWGLAYVRFLFSGPEAAGILHGDPHPGNFKLLPDGRLGVIDFGLVSRLPDGLPRSIGRLLSIALRGDAEEVAAGLRAEGFVSGDIDAHDLLDFLGPFVEPAKQVEFHFTRDWMRGEFARVRSASGRGQVGTRINLPPGYLLIHRVWLGGIAVLAQLDVRANFGEVLAESLPDFVPLESDEISETG
ncbi:ABC1 kinase family protein [Propionibacteriaceae bacterium Y2011]